VYDKSCDLGLQAHGRLVLVHGPRLSRILAGLSGSPGYLRASRNGGEDGSGGASGNKTYLRTLVAVGASDFFAFGPLCGQQ